MNTTENNRMIAEFMGDDFMQNEIVPMLGHRYPLPEDMMFSTSWDWLMPVVDKIEYHLDESFWIKVQRISNSSDYISNVYYGGYDSGSPFEIVWWEYPKSRKEATYIAVCKFIEWYNQNK